VPERGRGGRSTLTGRSWLHHRGRETSTSVVVKKHANLPIRWQTLYSISERQIPSSRTLRHEAPIKLLQPLFLLWQTRSAYCLIPVPRQEPPGIQISQYDLPLFFRAISSQVKFTSHMSHSGISTASGAARVPLQRPCDPNVTPVCPPLSVNHPPATQRKKGSTNESLCHESLSSDRR
jgi:hypothetical protein